MKLFSRQMNQIIRTLAREIPDLNKLYKPYPNEYIYRSELQKKKEYKKNYKNDILIIYII